MAGTNGNSGYWKRPGRNIWSLTLFVEKVSFFLRLKQRSYTLLNLNLAIDGCYKEI
jgi:hypothetical protein